MDRPTNGAPAAPRSRPAPGPSIDAVIDRQLVRTLFQPVVHLASGSISGFEALSRGPAGSALESPLALLDAARVVGRLGELDWLCRSRAMLTAADAGLPETLSWLINVEPAGLISTCPPHLMAAVDRARAELRVILEVVERDVQGSVLELVRASDQARRDAWGVALDDVGAEEGSLALLPFLRPDVVKLDMSLVRGVPRDAAATITAAVRAYAERTGAVILAEGIETQEQERLARVFGATYGQGYFYGRPGSLPASIEAPRNPIPLAQYVAPIDGRTPFEVLAATIEPQRADKAHLLHISAHLEDHAARDAHASVLLAGFQKQAYFSDETRARFDRLAVSNALTIVLGPGLPLHDAATYHIGPRPPGSRMSGEWVVIVVNPHFAAAFVAREFSDAGDDGRRQFDFVYTHDRDAVIDAGRCFLQDLAVDHTGWAQRTQAARRRGASTGRRGDRAAPAPAEVAPAEVALAEVVTAYGDPAVGPPCGRALDLASAVSAATAGHGFRATSQLVLDYLNQTMPMAAWSITRLENERQTHILVGDNQYGLTVGDGHPWADSYCINMVAGTAPRIAPDAAAVPLYAAAAVNEAVQIGAYAGAPITESDGTTFGAICGLDRAPRADLPIIGPVLDVFSELLSIALTTDRALNAARRASTAALTYASTDSLTRIHNRRAWDDMIDRLDLDYRTYADPTVIVIVDLDNLKEVNDGPGGHTAGDQLLRSAVHVMRRSIRDDDFLARLGGDEFGIILTRTPTHLAPAIARRLTRVLDRAGIPASVGWSPLVADSTVAHAVELADRAMYRAKHARKLGTVVVS
jgi:diguanylate cyclase (GGDEF)-like protein